MLDGSRLHIGESDGDGSLQRPNNGKRSRRKQAGRRPMKRPLDVEIMGQRLTVTSDEGDDHVRRVAEYVDQQMRQLAAGPTAASMMQLALLTALNIASEYWKLQHEQEELHRTINRLSQRVLARLER